MHSTQMTALAQAADANGWTIVALCEIPASQGTYPSAWVIAERDYISPIDYVVSMGVLPTEDREAHFTWSTYDLTRDRAQSLFNEKNTAEIRRAG
jgi:hypothetical protein